MNKKLTADLPVGRQGTAKLIAENRKEIQISIALSTWIGWLTNRAPHIALRLNLFST